MTQPTFGIKQTIRYEWVLRTADLFLQGTPITEIRAALIEYLHERKGTGNHGVRSDNTRDFVLANLMRTWVTPQTSLVAFRNRAAVLIPHCNASEHHAMHWGLMCATYPFWYQIARHTGRLLTLQGTMSQKQLHARLMERYGETQTVTRYSQYVVRSFTAWDVVLDTQTAGTYTAGPIRTIENPAIVGFLYEAFLHADNTNTRSYTALQNDPALFPYALPFVAPQTLEQHCPQLSVQRFGGQDEMVILT
jgi:hypothetical protein